MHSEILFQISKERSAEIGRRAELARRTAGSRASGRSDRLPTEVVLRLANQADSATIERLQQLEGRKLDGDLLVAEGDGAVLAAISLQTGEPIADPFRRTLELIELLQRGRAHLRGDSKPRSRRRPIRWLGGILSPRRRGRASVPTVPGNETLLIR